MKISKGFSEEVGSNSWAKADVELDEGDLERMLVDNGLSLSADLTHSQVYGILSLEAERLLTAEYLTALKIRGFEQPEGVVHRLSVLKQAVEQKLGSISG